MRTFWRRWRAWLALPLVVAALAGTAGWLLLDAAPRAVAPAAPDATAMWQVRYLLRRHDPRHLADGQQRVMYATAGDLHLLTEQSARLLGGSADADLAPGRLLLKASLPAAGRWANVELTLADGAPLPAIARLQVGAVVLPGWLAEPLLKGALVLWDRPGDGSPPLHTMVQGLRFNNAGLWLTYRWRADLPGRLSGWLLPSAQVARLQVYQQALAPLVAGQRGSQQLPDLLMPMFQLARERSAAGGDAAAENRAALMALALHAGGPRLAYWMPAAGPRLPRRAVLLGGRTDFPVHLLWSAALAAEGGGPLAEALGLAKELDDSRHGSGFSFNDIAINRVGTRLGERAVREPARVQDLLSEHVTADTLLPDLSDLPEFLPERVFNDRYGGVGAPAYEALAASIDVRVAAMPLWR